METKPAAAPPKSQSLRELTSGKLAEVGKKAESQQTGMDGQCMTVVPEPCFGFEIETKDGILAFPYHAFIKMKLSPDSAVLELELSDCTVKFRGQRLRYVMAAMRRSYDVIVRTIEAKYAQTIVETEPVITEITIEVTNEEAEATPLGMVAKPAAGDEAAM